MLSSLLLLFIQMFTIFTTSFPFALRCQHILFLYADNRRLPIFFYCIPFSHTFRCPCTAAVCWLLWHHLLITSIVVTRSFCLSLSPTHTHTRFAFISHTYHQYKNFTNMKRDEIQMCEADGDSFRQDCNGRRIKTRLFTNFSILIYGLFYIIGSQ